MNKEPIYRVRVGVPHYFKEATSAEGYGSSRANNRLPRTLALARCLQGLLALSRQPGDLMLNMRGCLQDCGPLRRGEHHLPPLQLEIHVFTDGTHLLKDVLDHFQGQIIVHEVELEDPRKLAVACRDAIIAKDPLADLTLYCEDDIVIGDPLFFDKQGWFLVQCKNRAVLMPHRYELIPRGGGRRLLPDGPLRHDFIKRFLQPKDGVASGKFLDGQVVTFDRSANPHSGLFCLNTKQVELLREKQLPEDGFVSPLETAATLTVMQHFTVLKPSLAQRSFLWVEHAHPTYINYVNAWPICPE